MFLLLRIIDFLDVLAHFRLHGQALSSDGKRSLALTGGLDRLEVLHLQGCCAVHRIW